MSTATTNQENPQLISDGKGGAFITWEDSQGGNSNIYAQHIDSTGTPKWAANGLAISVASVGKWNPLKPQIVSDGQGGGDHCLAG